MRTGGHRCTDELAGHRPHTAAGLPPDFYRLWASFTAGQVGGAVGAGALPLVAILLIDASDLQVSLMAALAGLAAAAIALPLGPLIEFRRKRGVMAGAGFAACTALASVPLAAWFGVLTYAHLCVTAAVQTLCGIVFNAARDAHLKTLVPEARRVPAASRLETTFWTATALGGPVGGLLIAVFGTTTTLIVDSLGHLASALGIRRIRTPETVPTRPDRAHRVRSEIRAGWIYIAAHATLHRLFWNAMLFGGSLMLVSPLMALLMLRELGFPPWQYGLALGIPGLGGLLGSWCAPRLVARFGQRPVLLGFGTLRTCWLGSVVLAGPGPLGFSVILVASTLLLFSAGVFNPVFSAYRMSHTPDDHMVRVGTAWSISARCVQPAFIALGGVLAAAIGVRAAIGVAALALLAGSALLPWGYGHENQVQGPAAGGPISGLDESRPDGIAGQGQSIT
ncbi:MFS transporter [Nocardia jinanensis]|uniref:MFS transporter n=1 Tax=Nocardia jinanensis TaxID=382504 RepID=A0A917RHF0_9NOCA|nr:MFS transporter [Nocardia jinanensis]GGL06828.1 MFS transporter [Nocardia jinanensis]